MQEDPKRIGLMVGTESTFPAALIAEINSRRSGVVADFVKTGGLKLDQPIEYNVILDRISHQIPFYRAYLKAAVLAGVRVVNNPFWWSADDKFFNYSLADRLGVGTPRTVLLPQKGYKRGVSHESLRNLEYPLNWEAITEYVGLPAILKPVSGGGWQNVSKVDSRQELMQQYDGSGIECMVLQEFIRFDQYIRAFYIAGRVLAIPYDPVFRRYLVMDGYLSQDLEDRVRRDCITLNRALGYEMNTVELAIRDGVAFAIDYMNPAPDADWWAIGPRYFKWVVAATADFLISASLDSSPSNAGIWSDLLTGRMRGSV
jgi:hypothetical protein